MSDLEQELRSRLADLPDPELAVPADLLHKLQRRHARRRLLAPAALVSVGVAALIAIPLGLAAGNRPTPRPPAGSVPTGSASSATLTLLPRAGAALAPGDRAAVVDILGARLRAAHVSGTVQPGSAPDTVRVTGLTHPLPARLLAVGTVTFRQVNALSGGPPCRRPPRRPGAPGRPAAGRRPPRRPPPCAGTRRRAAPPPRRPRASNPRTGGSSPAPATTRRSTCCDRPR